MKEEEHHTVQQASAPCVTQENDTTTSDSREGWLGPFACLCGSLVDGSTGPILCGFTQSLRDMASVMSLTVLLLLPFTEATHEEGELSSTRVLAPEPTTEIPAVRADAA